MVLRRRGVLLGITALGLLVVLIRAITAPGKNSQLELERDNGSIAITQNAIQSTVKHVSRAITACPRTTSRFTSRTSTTRA